MIPLLLPLVLLPLARTQEEEPDWRALVPDDAVLVLRIQSLDRAMDSLQGMARSLGTEAPSAARVLEFVPGDSSYLDRTKPLILAFTLAEGWSTGHELFGEIGGMLFGQSFVLPAQAPRALAESLDAEGLRTETKGSWVAGRTAPGWVAAENARTPATYGRSALLEDLPEGLVVLRVDLERLFGAEMHGQFVEAMLQQLQKQETPEAAAAAASIRRFVDAARWLELVLSVDADRATLATRIDLNPASELARAGGAPAIDLARWSLQLDPDAEASLVGAIELESASATLRQVYAALLEQSPLDRSAVASLGELPERLAGLLPLLDGRFALSVTLEPAVRFLCVAGTSEPAKVVEGLLDAGQDVAYELGVELAESEPAQAGEPRARELTLSRLHRVLADEEEPKAQVETVVSLLPLEDRVLVTVGGDATWRAQRGGWVVESTITPAAPSAPRLERLSEASPVAVQILDLGKVTSWPMVAGDSGAAGAVPMPRAPLTLWWGAKHAAWELGASFELEGGDFVTGLQTDEERAREEVVALAERVRALAAEGELDAGDAERVTERLLELDPDSPGAEDLLARTRELAEGRTSAHEFLPYLWDLRYRDAPFVGSSGFLEHVDAVRLDVRRNDGIAGMILDSALEDLVAQRVRAAGIAVDPAAPVLLQVQAMLVQKRQTVRTDGRSSGDDNQVVYVDGRFVVPAAVHRAGAFLPMHVSPAFAFTYIASGGRLDESGLEADLRSCLDDVLRSCRTKVGSDDSAATWHADLWDPANAVAAHAAYRDALTSAGTGRAPLLAGVKEVAPVEISTDEVLVLGDKSAFSPDFFDEGALRRDWNRALGSLDLSIGEESDVGIDHRVFAQWRGPESLGGLFFSSATKEFYALVNVAWLEEQDVVYEVDGELLRSDVVLAVQPHLDISLQEDGRITLRQATRSNLNRFVGLLQSER